MTSTTIRIDEFGRLRDEMTRPVSFGRLAKRGSGGGHRTHAALAVGQMLGPWRVIGLLGRGYHGRSDVRAVVQCTCGKRHEGFEYNLRKLGCQRSCEHGQMRKAKAGAA